MEECHSWDTGSAWHKVWPNKIYVGQWPICHGPVTLLNILKTVWYRNVILVIIGERGGSVVECRTPEREVRGSRPTSAVLCPWARHFTPRKYWLITQEAMAPSRHDWKIVDWDVKPQHNQLVIMDQYDTKIYLINYMLYYVNDLYFVAQWLCWISSRVFDEGISYFG